ncbi:hypothetical protein D9M69_572770 [compost metagenome]
MNRLEGQFLALRHEDEHHLVMPLAAHVLDAEQEVIAVVVDEGVALALEGDQRFTRRALYRFPPTVIGRDINFPYQRKFERRIPDFRNCPATYFFHITLRAGTGCRETPGLPVGKDQTECRNDLCPPLHGYAPCHPHPISAPGNLGFAS